MRFEGGNERGLDRRTVLQSVGIAGATGVGTGTALADLGANADQSPSIRGSVRQVIVKDAATDATLTLYGPDGSVAAEATIDNRFGSYVFEDIEPGEGYQVSQTVDGSESPRSETVRVLPVDYTPPQSFYDQQTLTEGFGYIETRDGTELAEQVIFPEGPDPPYPTLIIHSGYEPSVSPSGATVINNVVVEEFGYAVVGVNMRGTTCSDGKFDLGEQLQLLDGYDMVETVAAQDWVEGDVGLIGASFSGFTQLFVAATQPPSLAAIAPGHPIGDFYRDTVYPGGLRNATFATVWAQDRDSSFQAGGTEGNVDQRIANGDEICEENQELRPHNVEMVEQLRSTAFDDGLFDERGLFQYLDQIDVPTALVVSWQDEQTGGRATRLYEYLSDDIQTKFIGTSGSHYEYIGADVLDDLARFLTYYVGEEVPEGDSGPYEEALAAYEAEDDAITYWETSVDSDPRYRKTFPDWPPEANETWRLYFQPDGRLADTPPETAFEATSTYEYRPEAPFNQLISRSSTRGRLDWPQQPDGTYTAFVSDPLEEDRVCLGSGFVEVWLASEAEDTDLQVTVSEIRPDGKEMFVQTGWLRASHRKESPERSKPRRPWHTHNESDQEFLPAEGFANMRVELFPFGHAFRAGSEIKVAVETPGGNRDLWGLQTTGGETTNEVAHTDAMPSNVALPLLPDEQPEVDSYPPCGDVQNQPCRDATLDLPPKWGELTGTVSGDGEPVAGTTVGVADGDELGATTVAEDGTYAADLAPGGYELRVDAAAFEPASADVTVSAGETTTEDLALTPRPTGTLTGTVTAGDPVEGVDLAFTYEADTGEEVVETVTTGPDGTYEATLPATTYRVTAESAAYDYSATVTVKPDETELYNIALVGPQVALSGVQAPAEARAGETVTVEAMAANTGGNIAEDVALRVQTRAAVTPDVVAATVAPEDGTSAGESTTATVEGQTVVVGSLTGRRRVAVDVRLDTAGPVSLVLELTSSNAGSDTVATTVQVTPPPVVGDRPPQSFRADGLYDDVNGDGEVDILDVQALFDNLDSDAVQENPGAFNFRGNDGQVTILDVQALFNSLSEE
jgi:putative CocE/NonD family hydrolase